jgi:hypothetical protein
MALQEKANESVSCHTLPHPGLTGSVRIVRDQGMGSFNIYCLLSATA